MYNSGVIPDFLVSENDLKDDNDFLGLSVDCGLGDPVYEIAGMSLEQSKDSLIDLLVPDDCLGQLGLDVNQEINPGREGIDARNECVLSIIERGEQRSRLLRYHLVKLLNHPIELQQDVPVLVDEVVLVQRLLRLFEYLLNGEPDG